MSFAAGLGAVIGDLIVEPDANEISAALKGLPLEERLASALGLAEEDIFDLIPVALLGHLSTLSAATEPGGEHDAELVFPNAPFARFRAFSGSGEQRTVPSREEGHVLTTDDRVERARKQGFQFPRLERLRGLSRRQENEAQQSRRSKARQNSYLALLSAAFVVGSFMGPMAALVAGNRDPISVHGSYAGTALLRSRVQACRR